MSPAPALVVVSTPDFGEIAAYVSLIQAGEAEAADALVRFSNGRPAANVAAGLAVRLDLARTVSKGDPARQ